MPTISDFFFGKIPTLARHSAGSLFIRFVRCQTNTHSRHMENRKYGVLESEEQRKVSRKWHDKLGYFFVQAILEV